MRFIFRYLRSLVILGFCVCGLLGCGGGGGGSSQDVVKPPLAGLDARPANTTCIAPQPISNTAGVAVNLVPAFSNINFDRPVALLQAPDNDDRWYVVEQRGRVLTFTISSQGDAVGLSTFMQFTPGQVQSGGEAGLLGMAFHPDFTNNRTVFFSYTQAGTSTPLVSRIVRFKANAGGTAVDTAVPEELILALDQPDLNHNGGQIAFGPDGYLYTGFGDGGGANDTFENGQTPATLLGAMLRIDVDTVDAVRNTPYGIPADNPYANNADCDVQGGCQPEIYAYGFRNPWRWSFDRDKATPGELWVGDVGQFRWEEIDRVEKAGNYGWNIREGTHCLTGTSCSTTGLIEPVVDYSHDQGACSVTGGYVYRGADINSLRGQYVYGDYCSGEVWGLSFDAQGEVVSRQLLNSGLNISSFAEDNQGEMYVLGHITGKIYRLAAGAASVPSDFPGTLSATGCVDASNPSLPASGLIPYEVNVPFFSDGAQKQRWMALPDGATIHISPDGHWELPVGTVLMKHFRLEGKLIETRLFIHHASDEWAGYSYEWNTAQTDANLVEGGKIRVFDHQSWSYPSSAECLRCHTHAAGRTLGLETAQMNRSMMYPSTGRTANQLATYQAIGLFDAALSDEPVNLTALPELNDSMQDLATRARAYLHVNCAQCHRPDGPTPVDMDLRNTAQLSEMNICGIAPVNGKLGIADSLRVFPGDPSKSMLSLRLKRRDAVGMPPLGSHLVDDEGVALLDQWINSLFSCV